MLYDSGVWLAGLILLSPVFAFGLAWVRINRFYHTKLVRPRQKLFYLVALAAGSVSTLAYLGYWSWRVAQLYHATFPITVLLALERLISVSRVLSVATIACLLMGRGPYRSLLVLATLWVMFQLWTHGGVMNWD